jgi:hypothetical protein
MRTTIAFLLLALYSCQTSGPMTSNSNATDEWQVELATDGGITGRGNGTVTIERAQGTAKFGERTCRAALTDREREDVGKAVRAAEPERWRDKYIRADNPHGYADQIRYTVTLRRDGASYSAWWYDETRSEIPPDLAALHDLAAKVRYRLLTECAHGR